MRKELTSHGFSSILFAMIFAVILSLLAVGFATLVRNDQRQTLDQTLGYQAQYAAETAINQVAASLKNDPGFPSTSSNCVDFEVSTGSGVTVPCVTWTDVSNRIVLDGINTQPSAARIEANSSYDTLKITYVPTAFGTNYASASTLPGTINDSNNPILRLNFLINPTTQSTKQLYALPTTSNVQPPFTAGTGSVISSNCSSGSSCELILTNMNNYVGYVSLASLGQTIQRLEIQALSGGASGTARNLLNAQYTIDATAIAQDVTKRVEARIPAGKQTWRPGFSASVNEICKDIRIDGTNNTGISGDDTCVGRIP